MVFLNGFAKVYSHVETDRKTMQKEIAYIYNLHYQYLKSNKRQNYIHVITFIYLTKEMIIFMTYFIKITQVN